VGFSKKALSHIKRLASPARPELKAAVAQILRQDPRNPRDRSQLKPGKLHLLRLWDLEIRFFVRGRRALVESLSPAPPKTYLKPGRVPTELLAA
ncbi:MAG: hypothetical protein KGI84_07365, partial [Elusimicrobia bacterium]|nr:hypothetical protein [Elusimicrobiota bacterium]